MASVGAAILALAGVALLAWPKTTSIEQTSQHVSAPPTKASLNRPPASLRGRGSEPTAPHATSLAQPQQAVQVAPARLTCRVVDEFGESVRSGNVLVRTWGLNTQAIDPVELALEAPGVFSGALHISSATSVLVRFESEAGGSEETSVKLAPGRDTGIDLVSLRKARYRVIATRPDGSPVEGARVALDRLPAPGDPVTDAAGELTLWWGQASPLGCWVFAPDGAVGKSELIFPLPGEEYVLPVTCQLRLRELQVAVHSTAAPTQAPLKIGVRTASPLQTYDVVRNAPPRTISVVDDGELQVIVLDPESGTRQTLSWPSVQEAAPAGILRIKLDDSTGVRVRAVNERGDAIAGVPLKLSRADAVNDPGLAAAVVTDDEGLAAWREVKPGDLHCRLAVKEGTALASIEARPGSRVEKTIVLSGWLPVGGTCRLPQGSSGYVVLPRSGRHAPELRVKVRGGRWLASAYGSVGDTRFARLVIRGFGPEEATEVVLGRLDNVILAPKAYPVARLRLSFDELQRFSGYLRPESASYKPRRRKAFLLRQQGPVVELPGVPPGVYHFTLWKDPLGRRDLVARTLRSVRVVAGEVSDVVLVRP